MTRSTVQFGKREVEKITKAELNRLIAVQQSFHNIEKFVAVHAADGHPYGVEMIYRDSIEPGESLKGCTKVKHGFEYHPGIPADELGDQFCNRCVSMPFDDNKADACSSNNSKDATNVGIPSFLKKKYLVGWKNEVHYVVSWKNLKVFKKNFQVYPDQQEELNEVFENAEKKYMAEIARVNAPKTKKYVKKAPKKRRKTKKTCAKQKSTSQRVSSPSQVTERLFRGRKLVPNPVHAPVSVPALVSPQPVVSLGHSRQKRQSALSSIEATSTKPEKRQIGSEINQLTDEPVKKNIKQSLCDASPIEHKQTGNSAKAADEVPPPSSEPTVAIITNTKPEPVVSLGHSRQKRQSAPSSTEAASTEPKNGSEINQLTDEPVKKKIKQSRCDASPIEHQQTGNLAKAANEVPPPSSEPTVAIIANTKPEAIVSRFGRPILHRFTNLRVPKPKRPGGKQFKIDRGKDGRGVFIPANGTASTSASIPTEWHSSTKQTELAFGSLEVNDELFQELNTFIEGMLSHSTASPLEVVNDQLSVDQYLDNIQTGMEPKWNHLEFSKIYDGMESSIFQRKIKEETEMITEELIQNIDCVSAFSSIENGPASKSLNSSSIIMKQLLSCDHLPILTIDPLDLAGSMSPSTVDHNLGDEDILDQLDEDEPNTVFSEQITETEEILLPEVITID